MQLFKFSIIFEIDNLFFEFSDKMEPQFLHFHQSRLAYYRFGHGPKNVICFHGYGEDASIFSWLGNAAGEEFRFVVIDLPFHGQTEWQRDEPFTSETLSAIVLQLLEKENHPTTDQEFILMGYSLGGRMALQVYQSLFMKIDRMVLLAPDGLKVNGWYWLATQTWPGNRLFRFTMHHPGWFFGLLKCLQKLHLVNASIFKFVKKSIGDASQRHLLYIRWTAFRKIKPQLAIIQEKIKQRQTPVRLVYGKHDRIILSSVGEKFKKGIDKECNITILDAGHHLLQEKFTKEILSALQQ